MLSASSMCSCSVFAAPPSGDVAMLGEWSPACRLPTTDGNISIEKAEVETTGVTRVIH